MPQSVSSPMVEGDGVGGVGLQLRDHRRGAQHAQAAQVQQPTATKKKF